MSVPSADASFHPTSLDELPRAGRLIVWSFRRWVSGPENWLLVEREFRRHFAEAAAPAALRSFAMFVEALRCNARGVIRYHQPGCPCLGCDEVCLLNLIGAAQAGDTILAQATGRWLVRAEGLDGLVRTAGALGLALARQDLLLPPPSNDGVGPQPQPFDGSITIH